MKDLMKSFYLARIWGIDVFIHSSLILFLGFLIFLHLFSFGLVAVVKIVLLLVVVFVSLLLHEYGHCLVAKHYRIRVDSILLTPLGGIAKMEQIKNADVEIKVVLAGPLVNLAIAFLFLPIATATAYFWELDFFMFIVGVNAILAFFNLIPAFPLDGGRILRAFFSKKLGLLAATNKVVEVATIIAIGMTIIGIFTDITLIFIAVFIYIAGRAERDSIAKQSFF